MNMCQRLLTLASAAFAVSLGTASLAGTVVVNEEVIEEDVLQSIAQQYGVLIPAGRYWYDPMCGAWGIEEGPTLGFTAAGYPLGGELRADASGGSDAGLLTGVFVNGRELHPIDVYNLSQITPVYAGRFWMDHAGNAGYEGGPALVNLFQIAQQSRGGGSYQRRTAGGYIGSDGQTSYFFDPETGASVMN